MGRPRECSELRTFRSISTVFFLAVLISACDPLWVTSVSQRLDRPPDDACVLRVLQSSEHVRSVRHRGKTSLVGVLLLPPSIRPPRSTKGGGEVAFEVLRSKTKQGAVEFTFRVVDVGKKGSEEYRRYVEDILTKLQAATIEACTSHVGDQPRD